MDVHKDTDQTDEHWQRDAGWIDKLWNQVQGTPDTESQGKKLTFGADGKGGTTATDPKRDSLELEAGNKERGSEDQAAWAEEERLMVFKLKRRTAIPLNYLGHLFHQNYTEFRVKVYPVQFLDVCDPKFQQIASLATSFHVSIVHQNSVLELHTTRDKARTLMEGILSAKLKHSQVTVEVEQRKPDREEKDDDGKPYFFPILLNKAVLKVKTAHLQKNVGNQQSNETATEKQRSLFLLNLPETVDTAFLQILFPTCLKCTIAQLSGNMSSAILLTKSTKTAVHLLASIAEFHIDERTIHMGTSEASKKDADQLIANEAEATTAPLLNTGPASNGLTLSVTNTASSQNPAQLPFIKNTEKKAGLKRKSPSDIKRDNARRLKYGQKRLPLLPPAPLFPDEPSFHSMAASNIPPVPPFPDEFRLMSMSAAESRHPRTASNFPPAPSFSDDIRLTSMSAAESRHSYIPPAPPFPDELRLMSMSAAENGGKKTAAGVQNHRTSGVRPPGVSRFRSAYKIKRDKIRAEEFYAKKRKALEEQANANSSGGNLAGNVSTATAVPGVHCATQLQEPTSDSMTKPDGKMPQQQQTAPYSELQHSEMDIQGIQRQNTNPCHSTHKAGSSGSLQRSSGTQSKEQTKNNVQQTQQDQQNPASSDGQQHNRSGNSSDRFHWNRNKPANSAFWTDHRPTQPKDDCWHSDVPLGPSEAQRHASFGRDHHARDTAGEQEYYAAREDYDYERARAAREAYDYERALAAREVYDYERAVAAREVYDLEIARAAWRDSYY